MQCTCCGLLLTQCWASEGTGSCRRRPSQTRGPLRLHCHPAASTPPRSPTESSSGPLLHSISQGEPWGREVVCWGVLNVRGRGQRATAGFDKYDTAHHTVSICEIATDQGMLPQAITNPQAGGARCALHHSAMLQAQTSTLSV